MVIQTNPGCVKQQFKDVPISFYWGINRNLFIYGFIPSAWITAHKATGADNPFAIQTKRRCQVFHFLYIKQAGAGERIYPLASCSDDKERNGALQNINGINHQRSPA